MNFLKRIFEKKDIQPNTGTPVNLIIKPNHVDIQIDSSLQEKLAETSQNKITLSEQEKNYLIDYLAKEENHTNQNSLSEFDPLLEDAARLVVQSQMGSTPFIQRRMKLGYNRAAKIMETLERIGIVGQNQGSSARDVLIKSDAELEKFIQNGFAFFNININSFYNENKLEIEKRKVEYVQQLREQKLESEKNKIRNELLEKERKRKLQRDVYKELIDEGKISNQIEDSEWNREPIPQDVMDKVWNRDSGRCVKCGSQENLEFDHIIPFSKGGANTYRNLQILCKKCNIEKSNKIG